MASSSNAPAAVSPPKATTKPSTTCHWLPCNIDYDGMAPIHQYFAPQVVSENDGSNAISAAQFRGRGLLSIDPTHDFQGVFLKFGNDNTIETQASFQNIREWHHEHSIAVVQRETSQVLTAHDWCQVARAVHDPIPVDEE